MPRLRRPPPLRVRRERIPPDPPLVVRRPRASVSARAARHRREAALQLRFVILYKVARHFAGAMIANLP